jgi:hypothetical protein
MPAAFIDKKEQEILLEHLKKNKPEAKIQAEGGGGQMIIID